MTRLALWAVSISIMTCTASVAQTPSSRASERAYYVVLDTRAKTCSVVDKEPQTDTPNVTVATDAVYKSRAEAEAALPTLKPCAALKSQ